MYVPVIGLFCYNSLFFVLKNTQAISSITQRDASQAAAFIKKHIPSNSKVIGEPLYYYAVIQAGSDFQYLNLYEDLEVREAFHREVYDYDYLIVTDHHKMRDDKKCIDYYVDKSPFEEVARFQLPRSEFSTQIANLSIMDFPLLSDVERHGYNCTIYKRIK